MIKIRKHNPRIFFQGVFFCESTAVIKLYNITCVIFGININISKRSS
jgi:hypothetical protein